MYFSCHENYIDVSFLSGIEYNLLQVHIIVFKHTLDEASLCTGSLPKDHTKVKQDTKVV